MLRSSNSATRALGLVAASGLCHAHAHAQAPMPDDPTVPDAEHLFGDWSGLRTTLRDRGVDVHLDDTTETAADVAGGRRTGVDYAHQIAVRTDVDWDKLAGLTGFSTHGVVVNRAGRSASNDFAGDDILHVQEIYGSDDDVVARLAYLYGEQSFSATGCSFRPDACRSCRSCRS